MKYRLLPSLLICLVASTSYALQSRVGTSVVRSVASPDLMSGSVVGVPSSLSEASAVNPAAAATAIYPTIGFNYAALADLSGAPAYVGTDFDLGGIFPAEYGVYSASGRFVTSGPGLSWGTFGTANLSIAKALSPNLLIGAGVGLSIGSGDRLDWGLGLDLGFISIPGDLGALRGFSWGAAIDGIGKPFRPFGNYTSPLPAFTPSVGAALTLYRNKSVTVGLTGFMSSPSFQDLQVGLGGSLSVGKSARLRLKTRLDLRDLFSRRQAFPLSGGIDVTIRTGEGKEGNAEIRPSLALEPIAPTVVAVGVRLSATLVQRDKVAPVITIETPTISYFSPNGDGIKDTLVVPLTVVDNRFVAGYRLTIRGPEGAVVRTIDSPSLAVTATGFSGLLDRLLYRKAGVPVPRSLVWDGTDNAGRRVPDGRYRYTVSAWDGSGNRSRSLPRVVVVDTRSPMIHLVQPSGAPPIISPNGDGYKDSLEIEQSGSREVLWTGRFRNSAGSIIKSITWTDSTPDSFAWNGRGNGGAVLSDGMYSYTVSATDRAGNFSSASIPAILLDASRPAIRLNVSRDAISPGTKSPDQTVRYDFEVPRRNSVRTWRFAVFDGRGAIVRTERGASAIPFSYSFNGSDEQRVLPDGKYTAALEVEYRNGAHSTAHAAPIVIDRVPPVAHVTPEYDVFSPVGSGGRSAMVFAISATKESLWAGTIATGGGKVVERYQWRGMPPARLTWDGREKGEKVEPNGTYQFSIFSTDGAGNYGQSNVASFVLDARSKQLFLSTNYGAFSPGGVRDRIRIIPDVRSPNGLDSYRIVIVDRSGKVVGAFQGTGVPTGSFAWNGMGSDGKPVPGGQYRAIMTGAYANGTTATAATPWFFVVDSLPRLTVHADYHLFSPNGDGRRDTVTFTQSGTGGDVWVGRIQTTTGQKVLEKRWQGRLPPTFTWNGTDSLGNTVPNGSYTYLLSTVDKAGNPAQVEVAAIVVDTRPTQVYVTVDRGGFSPNGDGVEDSIGFTTVEKPNVGVFSWTLTVIDSAGKDVRKWHGTGGTAIGKIAWNGSVSGGGRVAADGTYSVRFVVRYLKGDVDTATAGPFLLVANPPRVNVKLSPLPFNPSLTAGGGRLSIGLTVDSLAPIASWRLQIYTPPIEELFYLFSGEGRPPAVLRWDGRAADGTVVVPDSVYSYHLTVVDSFGNRRLVTGNISIGAFSKPQP